MTKLNMAAETPKPVTTPASPAGDHNKPSVAPAVATPTVEAPAKA